MDWFLYDRDLHHERVEEIYTSFTFVYRVMRYCVIVYRVVCSWKPLTIITVSQLQFSYKDGGVLIHGTRFMVTFLWF